MRNNHHTNLVSIPHRPQRQFSVAIIGAGVGGLLLAAGLLRHNVPIELYEASREFTDTGFGISIGPAAHRALSLVDPNVCKAYNSLVTTHADSPGYESFSRTWFELVWATAEKSGGIMSNLQATPLGQTSVHRKHFLDGLLNALPPGKVRWGKSLVNMQETGNGVRMRFEDGEEARADVVIGCDGIHSRVRQCMLLGEQIRPQYSGMYAYRAVLDMETMIDAVGDRRARVATMYMGDGGYIVTYPIMHAKQVNVGFFKMSERWDHPTSSRQAGRDEMERDFGHMDDAVRSILRHIKNQMQWAVFENPPLSRYTRGHVAILGDAAHASTPHQGAGAGQAIEDVHVLMELLGDARVVTRPHAQAAFHAYDAIRRPRSQQVVTTSRDMGSLLSLRLDMTDLEETDLIGTLNKRLGWLWDLDVPDQAERARRIMVKHFDHLSWLPSSTTEIIAVS